MRDLGALALQRSFIEEPSASESDLPLPEASLPFQPQSSKSLKKIPFAQSMYVSVTSFKPLVPFFLTSCDFLRQETPLWEGFKIHSLLGDRKPSSNRPQELIGFPN